MCVRFWQGKEGRKGKEGSLVFDHMHVYMRIREREGKNENIKLRSGYSSVRLHDNEPEPINDWTCHLSMNSRMVFSSVVLCLTWSVSLSFTLCALMSG